MWPGRRCQWRCWVTPAAAGIIGWKGFCHFFSSWFLGHHSSIPAVCVPVGEQLGGGFKKTRLNIWVIGKKCKGRVEIDHHRCPSAGLLSTASDCQTLLFVSWFQATVVKITTFKVIIDISFNTGFELSSEDVRIWMEVSPDSWRLIRGHQLCWKGRGPFVDSRLWCALSVLFWVVPKNSLTTDPIWAWTSGGQLRFSQDSSIRCSELFLGPCGSSYSHLPGSWQCSLRVLNSGQKALEMALAEG